MKKKHLFLVDGYSFVFRAYYSLPQMKRSDGFPVGAIYGFMNMLLKLKESLREEEDHYILVALDSGRKGFRNEIYPEYKANRDEAPDDLKPQFPYVKKAAEALNLKAISREGFEADDIIATYTKKAEKEGMKVTIVSSDKDLMQLVNDQVEMYDSMKNKRIGINEVKEKFGVLPEQVLDFLSLTGDSSDNIPGVPGVGPKTASELLNLYENLDGIYQNIEKITQKKRKSSLIEFAEQARLSYKLASLDENMKFEEKIVDFLVKKDVEEKIMHFLQEMEFSSLITRFCKKLGVDENNYSTKQQNPKKNFAEQEIIAIESAEDLKKFLVNFTDKANLYFLLEEEKILFFDEKKIGIVSFFEDEAEENLFSEKKGIKKAELQALIAPYFADSALSKITYDLKKFIKRFDLKICAVEDIKVMSYVVLGKVTGFSKEDDNLVKTAQNFLEYSEEISRRIFDEKGARIYHRLDKDMIFLTNKMEKAGIKIDSSYLKSLSAKFSEEISKISQEIYKIAGKEFNIASPKQLSVILFEELGLKAPKKNKSGNYSTNSDVLEELAIDNVAIADLLLRYRTLSKLQSTYTNKLIELVNPETGRIHSTFETTSTSTGRLSSHDPNLQNIPIRTDEGKKIRKAFVAEKGKIFLSADYSQIELRLLAHIAEMEVLQRAFKDGKDIHKITAAEIFNISEDEVDADLRRSAKTINFGIIYGQSAFGLAKQLKISRSLAKEYIEAYFAKYPGIRAYMEKTKGFAREHGFVETLFGRKCFVPEINSKNPTLRSFSERAAINAPLQGSASDIIKKAMIQIDNNINEIDAKLILQVHDELVFEVREEEVAILQPLVKKYMENVMELSVPLTVNIKTEKNL